MEKLTKEEVLHVANLARLELKDEEIEEYSIKLKEILNKIDEINDLDIPTDDILIAPTTNKCSTHDDVASGMLTKDEVLANAPHKYDPYIEVRGVFND